MTRVERPIVSHAERAFTMGDLMAALEKRIAEKGEGAFISTHELLGHVAEEYDELVEAVRTNDLHQVEAELVDLFVTVVFGIACIRGGAMGVDGDKKGGGE